MWPTIPNVISPQGHSIAHPGQWLQMEQTENPTTTTAAATLSQTAEYTLEELSTKKVQQYSFREMDH